MRDGLKYEMIQHSYNSQTIIIFLPFIHTITFRFTVLSRIVTNGTSKKIKNMKKYIKINNKKNPGTIHFQRGEWKRYHNYQTDNR